MGSGHGSQARIDEIESRRRCRGNRGSSNYTNLPVEPADDAIGRSGADWVRKSLRWPTTGPARVAGAPDPRSGWRQPC